MPFFREHFLAHRFLILFSTTCFFIKPYIAFLKIILNQNSRLFIITLVMNDMASAMGGVKQTMLFEGITMNRFYNKIWLPFVEPKKRIFLLALAAYIALC